MKTTLHGPTQEQRTLVASIGPFPFVSWFDRIEWARPRAEVEAHWNMIGAERPLRRLTETEWAQHKNWLVGKLKET